jgi:hypothetical protein
MYCTDRKGISYSNRTMNIEGVKNKVLTRFVLRSQRKKLEQELSKFHNQ